MCMQVSCTLHLSRADGQCVQSWVLARGCLHQHLALHNVAHVFRSEAVQRTGFMTACSSSSCCCSAARHQALELMHHNCTSPSQAYPRY
jgi:hypothetical protein